MDLHELRKRKLEDSKMSLLSVLYEKVLKCWKINHLPLVSFCTLKNIRQPLVF